MKATAKEDHVIVVMTQADAATVAGYLSSILQADEVDLKLLQAGMLVPDGNVLDRLLVELRRVL